MKGLMHTICWAVAVSAACSGEPQTETGQGAAPKTPAAKVGRIHRVSAPDGSAAGVQIKKGERGWQDAAVNASLGAADAVRTVPGAIAVVRFDGGREIAMNGETALRPADKNTAVLLGGEIWLDGTGPFVVESPRGTVSLESGKGGVRFQSDVLTVSMISGRARLTAPSGEVTLVGADEAVSDASGVRKRTVRNPESLVSWTRKVRAAVAQGAADSAFGTVAPPSGLGTLVARAPGGRAPLPFEILTEDIQVRIRDNMAVTRVEQVFRNPTGRVVEGEYRFPIPENAALTGYDMEVNGRLMKGEIVERERGRKILKKVIDDYLDKLRDPALTEWEGGSTFKTRIFPIKPKEEKRIVLTHVMPLSGAAESYRYTLPVTLGATDSPAIPLFRITVDASAEDGLPAVETPLYRTEKTTTEKGVRLTFTANRFVPRADFVVNLQLPKAADASLVAWAASKTRDPSTAANSGTPLFAGPAAGMNERMFLLRLAPDLAVTDPAIGTGADWLFLVDTSESRYGPDMEISRRLTGALIDALGPEDRVKVTAFDTFPRGMTAKWLVPGEATRQQVQTFLEDIEPGGASNPESALEAARAEADAGRPLRVVLIGDGVATVGETAPGRLADRATALFEYPHTVSTVGVGSGVDRTALEALAARTGGRSFTVSNGEDLFAAAVRVIAGLRGPALEDPVLTLNGVTVRDRAPETLLSLPAGGQILVAGRYDTPGRLVATLSGRLAGAPWQKEWGFDLGGGSPQNGFVPLVWAKMRLDDLSLLDTDAAKSETVAVSKKYGVASRLTSFIVLENNAMYREFGVKRAEDRDEWQGEEIEYEVPEEEFAADEMEEAGAMDGIFGSAEGAGIASGAGVPRAAKPKARGRSASPSVPIESKKSASEEAPQRRSKSAPSRSRPMSSDGRLYRSPPPRPQYRVAIHSLSRTPSDGAVRRASELAQAVQAHPDSRRARRRLVAHLLRNNMLTEASSALADWLAKDRAHPEVHLYLGDLKRLSGDLPGALRAYSGALDVQPESRTVLQFLADCYENGNEPERAMPFWTTLAGLQPNKPAFRVRFATAAVRAGKPERARAALSPIVETVSLDGVALRRKIKLSKSDRETAVHIMNSGTLPLLYDRISHSGMRRAGLRATLTWRGNGAVRLWPSTARTRYAGGTEGRMRLTQDETGRQTVFFVTGDGKGRFRLEVVCTDASGCTQGSGVLAIESHGKRRSVPISFPSGNLGAAVSVSKLPPIYYR